MTDRPTPEQLAADLATGGLNASPSDLLDELHAAGYVIVHPDDHPEPTDSMSGYSNALARRAYIFGYNDARYDIFGDVS